MATRYPAILALFLLLIVRPGICETPPGDKVFPAITVDTSRLKADVFFLTTLQPPRYYKSIPSLNRAADYIRAELEKSGLAVEEQKYIAYGREFKNIIASIGPAGAERIIIGAHYDVCDSLPGADDNASGVAGLLELARLLSAQMAPLKYRIDLVAYTLEEPPFFGSDQMGSAVHAKYLLDNKIKVRFMVSLEMIGYFSDQPKSQGFPVSILKWFYPTTANYIAVAGKFGEGKLMRQFKKNMKKGSLLPVVSVKIPRSFFGMETGIDWSDHLYYWQYGFHALMITDTSFYRNHHYHEKTDTADTLDYKRMGEVVKGIYWTLMSLASG